MKKFLLSCFLIFMSVCLTLVGGYLVYFIRLRNMSFTLPRGTTMVFCGTSHSECGVDVSVIPRAANFSMSGCINRLYHYFKVRKILESNKNIKTVFLTFDPYEVMPNRDDSIFADFVISDHLFWNMPLFDFEESRLYFKVSPWRTLKYILQKSCHATFLRDKVIISNIGHQIKPHHNERKMVESVSKAAERLGTRSTKSMNCDYEIAYTRKLVDLVRSHGAEVIFVDTPFYKADELFSKERLDFFNDVRTNLFSDVNYWNYRDFPIPDDCRRDANHLNRWGAEIFSKELARRIKAEGLD